MSIFFIKGDASLSPGALTKLKALPETWGREGTWILACPSNPDTAPKLRERRLQAIRTQLKKHGVPKLETRLMPAETIGKYDTVHIEKSALRMQRVN